MTTCPLCAPLWGRTDPTEGDDALQQPLHLPECAWPLPTLQSSTHTKGWHLAAGATPSSCHGGPAPCPTVHAGAGCWVLGSYRFFRCWMLPRHLSRPFTMMARRVQSASHSSMLGRQRRLQQAAMGGTVPGATAGAGGEPSSPGHHPGAVAPPPGMGRQQRVSRAVSAPRAPAGCQSLGIRAPSHPCSTPGAQRYHRSSQNSPRPVRCQHHRATRFDDVQDEVPEEAPCLGVHPCGGLILGSREHPQVCPPLEEPCCPHPVLSPAQDTISHPRRLMAELGAGSSYPGSFLHQPAPAPGTQGVGGGPHGQGARAQGAPGR